MGYGGGWNPLSDCQVEDAKLAMVDRPKGAVRPSVEEVIS